MHINEQCRYFFLPFCLTLILRLSVANGQQDKNALQRIRLVHADSIQYLKDAEKPDVVYMDPMYPQSKKTAKPKIEMEYLRALLGENEGVEELLSVARQVAKRKVVLKRPLKANVLPDVYNSLESKEVRFDIFLPIKEQ